MSYVKKRTTLVLFFLLIITIVSLSVSIIYFQKSLTRLNDDLADKQDRVVSLNSQVYSLEQNMTEISQILSIQLKREENLSELYLSQQLEKTKLKDEYEEVYDELNDTAEELYLIRAQLIDLEIRYSNVSYLYDVLNNSYDNLLDDMQDVCEIVEANSINASDCEDYI